MNICILGAGALGSAIGGALARAGADVVLVTRSKSHVDAINRNGLTLREGGADRMVKVRAATSAAALGPVDLVIVLVKSLQTREAIEQARAIVGPDTIVMSLQNGLGHEDVLAEVVGRERVLAGKTYKGGVMLAPGHVIAGIEGKETIIGELDGRHTERVQRIADTFSRAGLQVTVSTNIVGTMWDKLLVNVATGALAGITRLPYGGLYAVPEVKACALAAVAEGIAVAKAAGVVISWTDPEGPWAKAAEGLPPEFKTSLLQSLENGSPTEIDFINGSVVRWGDKTGVSTPVNRALVACVKGIEYRMKHLPEAAEERPMPHAMKSYVEHVAIRVRDIHWHIRFFREVLGMTIREVDGSTDRPKQVWTVGGVQLMADPDFEGPEGRLAHLGVMTEDLEAALAAAKTFDVTELPQGRNWLSLPDGLSIEIVQASAGSVASALAVNARA